MLTKTSVMASGSNTEDGGVDVSKLDDGILVGDDNAGTFTIDFLEMVDNLILGYTNIDVHGTLAQVDVANLDEKSIRGLLAHIGGLAGEEGQRVALIHILLERGDLNAELLDGLIHDTDQIGEVWISDPPRNDRDDE